MLEDTNLGGIDGAGTLIRKSDMFATPAASTVAEQGKSERELAYFGRQTASGMRDVHAFTETVLKMAGKARSATGKVLHAVQEMAS